METVALVSSYDKEDMASIKVLHSCTILTHRIITNRLHILFHFTVTLLLLYYRISHFFNGNSLPALSWALITISEIIFTFIWCLTQAFRWRPLSRTVSIDEIPANMNLEGLDVFVCTADPRKEPTMEVMNTIISALALDYPPGKLAVYLSDDGGSYITLYALKEAFAFSKRWLPFCMKYRIKTRCPEAFFSLAKYEELSITDEFSAKKDELEMKYNLFKRNVEKICEDASNYVVFDRPAHAEIIHGDTYMDDNENDEESTRCLSLYMSHAKDDLLNLIVSKPALSTPLQAMCFHLDPQMSPSLAFVQFPQMFYNISKNDIYDNQARSAYRIKWQGMDGIRGPSLSDTSFYLKRKALYGSPNCEDKHPSEAQRTSGELMKFSSEEEIAILKEAKLLASCNYERNTKWGEEARCLGSTCEMELWFVANRSVKVQSSLVRCLEDVNPTKHVLRIFHLPTPVCHCIPHIWHNSSIMLPEWHSLVPQYLSAIGQQLHEVLSDGGTTLTWWNEQRIWVIKSVSGSCFGCLDLFMKWSGMKKTTFRLTNKAVDKDKLEKYEKGEFDFQGATMFMIPLSAMAILNMACFIGGLGGIILRRNYEEMFGQIFLSLFIMALSYPMIQDADGGWEPGKVFAEDTGGGAWFKSLVAVMKMVMALDDDGEMTVEGEGKIAVTTVMNDKCGLAIGSY
ncbi:hypothetical protein GOBAR_DD29332 [Gossypium barbadense]|nr:hypothetical protein GOBAR_DD29332 [Gossypium barbadense]